MLKSAIITFFMAMLPIIELRGAIPYGVIAGLSIPAAFTLAVLGSIAPVPILVAFTRMVFEWLRKMSDKLDGFVRKLEAKADEHKDVVLKYGFWGLVIIAAIPLPGGGAWMGSLVAAVMDIRLRIAVPAIAIGTVIAGIIVTTVTYGAGALF